MIETGASLRECCREAERLGVRYWKIRRTGEYQFEFPGKRIKVNARRKDAPRILTVMLRKLGGAT